MFSLFAAISTGCNTHTQNEKLKISGNEEMLNPHDSEDITGYYRFWTNSSEPSPRFNYLFLLQDSTYILTHYVADETTEQKLEIGTWNSRLKDNILVLSENDYVVQLAENNLFMIVPKYGKIHLFDILENEEVLKNLGEEFLLYSLAVGQRKREYAVVFWPDSTREKYLGTEKYRNKPLELEKQIKHVHRLYNQLDSYLMYIDKYEKQRNPSQENGVWPANYFGSMLPESDKTSVIKYQLTPIKPPSSIRGIVSGRLKGDNMNVGGITIDQSRLVVGNYVISTDTVSPFIVELALEGSRAIRFIEVKYNASPTLAMPTQSHSVSN